MPDNNDILSGLLGAPRQYYTPEQRRRAQQHAYALLSQDPKERYTNWAQTGGDVLKALAGRSILNQTTEQEREQTQQEGNLSGSLMGEIQRRNEADRQRQEQSAAPTPKALIETGSIPPKVLDDVIKKDESEKIPLNTAPPPPEPELPSKLGGPDPSGENPQLLPQGQQVAQANGIPPAVAAPSGSVNIENLKKLLGNPMLPPASRAAIEKMMIEGATPKTRETGQGPQELLPSNPAITSMPGQQQFHPIAIGNIHTVQRIQVQPDGTSKTEVMLPSGKWGTFDEALQYTRNQEEKTAKQVGTAQQDTQRYADTFGGIQEIADKSQEQIPRIQKMRELIKDPRFYSGSGEDRVLDANRALHALGISPDTAAPTEVFKKLAAGETLNELKQFNGHGRVLATEFDQLKESLANTKMTQPAIDNLLKMSEKLHTRAVNIGDEASKYALSTEHKGLDKGWDVYLRQWKRNHPSISEEDVKEKVGTREKKPKIEKLPNGATREKIE